MRNFSSNLVKIGQLVSKFANFRVIIEKLKLKEQ